MGWEGLSYQATVFGVCLAVALCCWFGLGYLEAFFEAKGKPFLRQVCMRVQGVVWSVVGLIWYLFAASGVYGLSSLTDMFTPETRLMLRFVLVIVGLGFFIFVLVSVTHQVFQQLLLDLTEKDFGMSANGRRIRVFFLGVAQLAFILFFVLILAFATGHERLNAAWFRAEMLLFLFSGITIYWVRYAFPSLVDVHSSVRFATVFRARLRFPLQVLILLFLISSAQLLLPWDIILGAKSDEYFFKVFMQYKATSVHVLWMLGLAWLGWRLCSSMQKDFDVQSFQFSRQALSSIRVGLLCSKALIILTLAFAILRVLQFEDIANSLFATSAVGTVVLGLAAREGIANIFGGMQVMLDRPFSVGDYILSSDKDIEGTVESIGWRITLIRTPKRTLRYIPNSLFSTITIENQSLMSNRRVRIKVGIRYKDYKKMAPICQALEEYLANWDEVDKRLSNFVTFENLGESSMNFIVNFYTKPVSFREYYRLLDTFLHEVVKVVHQHKADFAFPTRTLDAEEVVKRLKKDAVGKTKRSSSSN